MSFEVVVGLEVHVQLNTNTKIFCSCATSFGDEANSNVCPICLGLPGALPSLNKEAVKKAISFGTAINATINQDSTFARKNYFYPDLPKAYQISQFDRPIVENGYLDIDLESGNKRIGIARAHLEEDAGKSIHAGNYSKVDLNRACTPLLEIVSAPEMSSSYEAISYLKKLHNIVQFLDISDANMQEGSFRCDANVSIRPKGDSKLYTRVEIKNINSFRFIQKAIDYEVSRQIEAWEDDRYDELVRQETRLYDADRNITRSMRGKEEAADYRYFNDPDLLRVHIDSELMQLGTNIPELPDSKMRRYVENLGIKSADAVILTSDIKLSRFFESMIELQASPKLSANWVNNELLGRLKGDVSLENCGITPDMLAKIVSKIDKGSISGKGAKELLDALVEQRGGDIDELIVRLSLEQDSNSDEIDKIIKCVLESNSDKVAELKAGKDKLFGFFVGQVMKELKSANPKIVNDLLKKALES